MSRENINETGQIATPCSGKLTIRLLRYQLILFHTASHIGIWGYFSTQHACCYLIIIVSKFRKVSQLGHLEISAIQGAQYKDQNKISCNSSIQTVAKWSWAQILNYEAKFTLQGLLHNIGYLHGLQLLPGFWGLVFGVVIICFVI